MRIRTYSTVVSALLLAAGATLSAHDFWLEPSTYAADVDQAIRIHLRVGERFDGEPVARHGARIERFVASGPSGEKPILGRDGMDPAGLLRLDAAGVWFVGYRSKPSAVELPAGTFEQYLREEGLERVIAERAERGESRLPGRERFSRSVKSLLHAGRWAAGRTHDGFDRALGLTLEFVLEADPADAGTRQLPARLLREGRPLADALVVAYRKDPMTPSSPATEERRVRTDRDGRVVLPMTPGVWLLKAVDMQRASAAADADWDSVWTSLTFQVPGATGGSRE